MIHSSIQQSSHRVGPYFGKIRRTGRTAKPWALSRKTSDRRYLSRTSGTQVSSDQRNNQRPSELGSDYGYLGPAFCSGSDQRKSRRADRNCFMFVGPVGRAGAGGRHQGPAGASPEALAAHLFETRTRLANLQSRLQELDQLDQTLVDLDPEPFKGEVQEVIHGRLPTSLSRQVATRDAAARIALAERVSELIAQNASVTAELRQFERDARVTRLLHETFISRLEEAAVQQGAQPPDSRIISTATPGKQVAPRSGLIMFLGVIAGAALGLGIVLARQIRQSAVPIGADLELATSVPDLGRLPLAPIRQRSQLVGYLSTYPTSPHLEAARNLQTSVLSPYADAPPQVILCTSSVPDEGKTEMSIALAQSMAGLGRSVLLVEADIRSLSFRAYFPDNPNGGLITALTGGTPLGNLPRTDTRLSVNVLMGERSTRSAADAFSSSRFHDLTQRLRAD